MLYQLALYALGRSGNERASAILYPTVDATAREQAIAIHEPVQGVAQARVALCPMNLLVLDQLLRARATLKARQECATLAHWLAFGTPS